jgi:hypothetical protein
MAARKWTPEQRQRQRGVIRLVQPWAASTGPRTPEGKKISSRNAWSGGCLVQLRALRRVVTATLDFLKTPAS